MTWGIFKSDSVSEAYKKMKAEELKGKQHKLDVDKDGKIEGEDLAKLRATKEEVENVEESSSNPHATNDRVYSTPTGTVHRAKPGVYGGHKKDKEEIKLKSPKALDKMDKALTKEEVEIDEAMRPGFDWEAAAKRTKEMKDKGYERGDAPYTWKKIKPEDKKDTKKTNEEIEEIQEGGQVAGKEQSVHSQFRKSDVPAYLRKQQGEKPLTVADVKGPRKDSISHKDNLAKARNEEVDEAVIYHGGDPFEQPSAATIARRERAREKRKQQQAQQKQQQQQQKQLNKEGLDIFNELEIDSLINEVLKASDDAGKWISDFIKSDDPRFKGDSKEQRKKRALAAYYAAQKKESVDYDSFLEEATQGEIVKSGSKDIKHANVKDKEDDQEIMEPHSQGEQDFLDKHSVVVTDDPAGEYKSGSEKLAVAGKPKASGAGKYDGKNKTGVKEETSEDESGKETISEEDGCACESSCQSGEKRSGKKTYTAFKEKMNYKKGC